MSDRTNAPSQLRSSRRHPILAALTAGLFVIGCLQSQSFLVPVFAWSFLSLTALATVVWVWRTHRARRIGRSWLRRLLILTAGVLLGLALSGAASLVSVAFLLTSVACAFLSASVAFHRPQVVTHAVRLFVSLHIVLAVLGAAAVLLFDARELFYVPSDSGGYFRLRGLALEPNHLGFSISAVYLVTLFAPAQIFGASRRERWATAFALWALALLTFSPFAIAVLVVTTTVWAWTSSARRLVCVTMLVLAGTLFVQSDRFELIANGEDNSTNLRTWGSLAIAMVQVENCGVAGCGMGSARSILEDEPLMAAFAAQDTLVLPNLFAGALVEGGYLLAAFFFLAMCLATWPPRPSAVSGKRVSLASFLFLVLFAATGSYPYDAHFWAVLGLLSALVRAYVIAPIAHVRPKENPVC